MRATKSRARVFAADEQDVHEVDVRKWMSLARNVLAAEDVLGDVEMTLMFVGEETMAELNQRFMEKEGPTDVLSFPIDEEVRPEGRIPDAGTTSPTSEEDDEETVELPLLLGDVVVCPAVAFRNAPDHAGTYENELALLIVHGILHLLGWDHEDDTDAEAMEARERELLADFYGPIKGMA